MLCRSRFSRIVSWYFGGSISVLFFQWDNWLLAGTDPSELAVRLSCTCRCCCPQITQGQLGLVLQMRPRKGLEYHRKRDYFCNISLCGLFRHRLYGKILALLYFFFFSQQGLQARALDFRTVKFCLSNRASYQV